MLNQQSMNLDEYFDIPNYEGLYKINKNCEVISLPKPNQKKYITKKPEIHKGYHRTTLFKNGKGKHFFIHQLMAIVFIGINKEKTHINHIDGNKLNNNIDNIEWCTPKENIAHSIKTGLAGTNRCRKHKTNKSGYIGVHFHKHIKKFCARLILQNGLRKNLGYFNSAKDAAIAYNNALLNEWGNEYEFNIIT